jgi:hypothetical protein
MEDQTRRFFISLKGELEKSIFVLRMYRFSNKIFYDENKCLYSKAERFIQDYMDQIFDIINSEEGKNTSLYKDATLYNGFRLFFDELQYRQQNDFPHVKLPLLEIFEAEEEEEEEEY